MEKEELNTLIEKTLRSVEDIARAEADPSIMESIKTRLSRSKNITRRPGYVLKLAAVFAVLICLNLFAVFNYVRTGTSEHTNAAALETLAEEYFVNSTNNY